MADTKDNPSAALLALALLRATLQRCRSRKLPPGLLPYHADSLANRRERAEWQISRCPQPALVEIGCGRDLHLSIIAASLHGRQCTAFDVSPLADLDTLNFTLRHCLPDAPLLAKLTELVQIGIKYEVAPSPLPFPPDAALVSCASFEHIPPNDLENLFALAASAKISDICAEIDFTDHWHYLYPQAFSPCAFYSLPSLWVKALNSPTMYQNRLRLPEFISLARRHGYHVAESQCDFFTSLPPLSDRNSLFRVFEDEGLRVRSALVHWRLQA